MGIKQATYKKCAPN